MRRKVIAVDFDGTLVENKYPDIGFPRMEIINRALEEKNNGTVLILWTCRSGKQLQDAIDYCKSFGLEFDAVNENIKESMEYFNNNSRKVFAHEYWDDRAVKV